MGCPNDAPLATNLTSRFVYPLLLAIPVCLLGNLALMSALAPIAEEYSLLSLSNASYGFLSSICHQYPTRCLWILNRPMGLCSRCFSVYASFSIGILCLPLVRKQKGLILSAFLLLPLFTDGLIQHANLSASNNLRRVLTGILFGAAASVLYKRSAFTLLSRSSADPSTPPLHGFVKALNFAYCSGILMFTIFYSIIVYMV